MTSVVAALAPIFLTILVGWGARFSNLVPAAAWGGANKLAYNVLGPVWMVLEVSQARLSTQEAAFLGAGLAAFLAMGACAFLLLPATGGNRHTFASAHQGATRWNAFALLGVSGALLGPESTGLVALIMGPAIPIVNVMVVSVHSRWGTGQNPSLRGILVSLAKNPMVLSCVIGLLINVSGYRFTGWAGDTMNIVGRGALGVTLMCVGAGLDLKAIGSRPALMSLAVLMKLVVGPAVFIGAGLLFGLNGVALATLAMIGASPSPPAAYTLTREMGGDPTFMAGHITATTILSALAIPAAVAIALALGG